MEDRRSKILDRKITSFDLATLDLPSTNFELRSHEHDMRKDIAKKILDILKKSCPPEKRLSRAKSDPYRAVIGTALSAQTTDDQVDRVTPELFRKYPTPKKLGQAKVSDVEKIIKPVGLYKTKAKNIIRAGKMIAEEFAGKVPSTREEMMKLPGVGRKTANVVIIKAFGGQAMPVDTHVFRVSNRIGISKGKTPDEVEKGLLKVVPKKDLGHAHFWLIHHGRAICHAKTPECDSCPISKYCDYYKSL